MKFFAVPGRYTAFTIAEVRVEDFVGLSINSVVPTIAIKASRFVARNRVISRNPRNI